ncbi:MAG: class I mannose-6-phosphate isomerase [Candidatus Methylomirabilota bacterium]
MLDRLQGRPRPEDAHFPEEWVGSTTTTRLPGRPADEGLSRVVLPDGPPVLLKSLVEAFPEAMLGAAHVARHGRELAVLCKILDTAMRLPIQCHPDQSFARRHLDSDFGKTESWIILGTRTLEEVPPYILFGFRDGVSEEAFRHMVETQDIPAQVAALNRIEVSPGEVYLVVAGTPHAIGPGVLMVEVQEPSDLVVNTEYTVGEIRRTEVQCFMGLGFELGMRCFNSRAAGAAFVDRHRLAPRILHEDGQGREEVLIGPEDTPCFGVARLIVQGKVPDRDRGRCYNLIVAAGRGRLTGPDCELPLQPGTTLFIPAASQHVAYHAASGEALTLIKCFPPPS